MDVGSEQTRAIYRSCSSYSHSVAVAERTLRARLTILSPVDAVERQHGLIRMRERRGSPERSGCLSAQQDHGPKKCRRLRNHSLRRVWPHDCQLLADHVRLELLGAPLSTTRRDPEGHVEVPDAQPVE